MEAEILTNFKPMIEAYQQIERLEAMLQQPLTSELRKVTERMQAEAVTAFFDHLDHHVDARLIELLDIAQRELVELPRELRRSGSIGTTTSGGRAAS